MLKINLQKRTGRKPKIDKDELLSILHSYKNRLFRNGKLDFGGSVWSDIERDMGFKIKKKSIYLIVSQDRYGLLTNLKKTLGTEPLEKQIVTPMLSEIENSTTDEDNDSICSESDQQFSLDIPYDVYRKMKPVTME